MRSAWMVVLVACACSNRAAPTRTASTPDEAVVVADAAGDASQDGAVAPVDASVASPPATSSDDPGCKIDLEARRTCLAASKIYGRSLALGPCGGKPEPPDPRDREQPCACYSAAESEAHADHCKLVPSRKR